MEVLTFKDILTVSDEKKKKTYAEIARPGARDAKGRENVYSV